MKKPTILVYGGTVVTMESEEAVYSPGYIYIEDGVVRSVGKARDIPEEYKSAELIYNVKGRIVFPGFINMHTHLGLYPIRMLTPNTTLDSWIENYAWNYERKLSERLSYYASKLSIYSLMKKGVVGVYDMHFNMEGVLRAVEEAGIYANLSVAIMRRGVFESFREGLKENLELIEKVESKDRISASLGPCSLRLLEKDELEEISRVARKLNVKVQIHLSEVREDVKYVKEKYNTLPVQLLDEIGLLNERTILAHCVWCTQKELHLIKKRRAKIVFCPSTNMHMNSGFPPVVEVYNSKLSYGFGTDVSPSQDLLEEASITYYYMRMLSIKPSPYKILEALIKTGGESLVPNRKVGVIREGQPATLVILKSSDPEGWNPIPSRLYEQLLFGKIPVETVIVDGEVLIDGGENLVLPMFEMEEAKEYLRELVSSLDLEA